MSKRGASAWDRSDPTFWVNHHPRPPVRQAIPIYLYPRVQRLPLWKRAWHRYLAWLDR